MNVTTLSDHELISLAMKSADEYSPHGKQLRTEVERRFNYEFLKLPKTILIDVSVYRLGRAPDLMADVITCLGCDDEKIKLSVKRMESLYLERVQYHCACGHEFYYQMDLDGTFYIWKV